MTTHQMFAFIHHAKENYRAETINWQNDIFYHLEAMLYSIGSNGCAFMKMEKYDDTARCFEAYLDLIETLFKNEKYLPPLHRNEFGNVYLLLAEARLGEGDREVALRAMEKGVDYELNIRPKLPQRVKPETPLFRDVDATPVYRNIWTFKGTIDKLLKAVKDKRFAELKEEPRYIKMLEALKAKMAE